MRVWDSVRHAQAQGLARRGPGGRLRANIYKLKNIDLFIQQRSKAATPPPRQQQTNKVTRYQSVSLSVSL